MWTMSAELVAKEQTSLSAFGLNEQTHSNPILLLPGNVTSAAWSCERSSLLAGEIEAWQQYCTRQTSYVAYTEPNVNPRLLHCGDAGECLDYLICSMTREISS
jgi:hypothetical protein